MTVLPGFASLRLLRERLLFYTKEIAFMKSMRALVFLLSVASVALAQSAANANWPQWRGPNRDGISTETGLLKQWPAEGPALVWKATGAGRGYSSFSVSNGNLYTMGLRGDREFIVAFD